MPKNQNQGQRPSNAVLVILIVFLLLLLGAAGFLGYKFMENSTVIRAQQKQVDHVTQEKSVLAQELADLKKKYQDLLGVTEETDKIASDRLKRIEKFEAQLLSGYVSPKSDSDNGNHSGIRREIKKLRTEYNELLGQLDRLRAENSGLKSNNIKLNGDLTITKQQNDTLSKITKEQKEKLEVAALLHAGGIEAQGIQVKKNGKEVPSDKSKKVNKFECCFRIDENIITEPGDKDVYLVIRDPGNKVLAGGGNTFEYMGESMSYTQLKTVYYGNKAMDMCMEFMPKDPPKGIYKAEIYIGGVQAGKTTFELK